MGDLLQPACRRSHLFLWRLGCDTPDGPAGPDPGSGAFSGILAGQPLPDTERLSLGGYYATRRYDFDDVSVDRGFVWRNGLRAPTVSPLQR
ncbi:ShlB/FhaC/HecB family hemolysin secretion/activation protein [Chelativorans sp. YIM 93263]|uniref:ShlB/FhaC/HecB family hemolysin secretion/activation protein n=1 Tax=Chelativorans sp. YIM 93263 TaxID=2906648 RepID=UPI00403DE80C